MLLLMGAVERSSHKVCWLQAAESGNDCVNWEVLDPAQSSVGRAGSVAWGRRPGRGWEEERAPCSWKAAREEALLAVGGHGCGGSVLVLRCTSKQKCTGWAGFGFASGSDSGIKLFFGLTMLHPCSSLETLCFFVKWRSWLLYPLPTSTKPLLLPASVTQPLQESIFQSRLSTLFEQNNSTTREFRHNQ